MSSDQLKVLTTVNSEVEAEIVAGRLADAGIRCMHQAGGGGAQWNPGAAVQIFVAAEDLDGARAALESGGE